MSRHRHRIDRDTAERLLSGAAVHPGHHHDRLARLIAAAGAPPDSGETPGDQAAMDAFRAARLDLAHSPRRPSVIETALAKLLTLKIAAAAVVAATATGGVALAASTGVLPNPLGGDTPRVEQSQHPTGRPSTTTGQQDAAGTPSPSLIGLCRAYAAGAGDNDGKALENPAFEALIAAAGDRDKVDRYCDTALTADTHGRPAGTPATERRPGGGTAPDSSPGGTPPAPGTVPSTMPTRAPATPDNDHKPTAAPTP